MSANSRNVLLLILTVVSGHKWVELKALNNKREGPVEVPYYSKNYLPESDKMSPIMMPLRLGGIAVLILQTITFITIMLHLFVWTEWSDLGNEAEMTQLMQTERARKTKAKKKRREQKRQREERKKRQVMMKRATRSTSSEHLHSAKDELYADEQDSPGNVQNTQMDGSVERIAPARLQGQSTRLPRAKKGHQADMLKVQEQVLEEDEEEGNDKQVQNQLLGEKHGGRIYESFDSPKNLTIVTEKNEPFEQQKTDMAETMETKTTILPTKTEYKALSPADTLSKEY